MPTKLKDIIEQLKLERSILKDGGYGRSVHTPWKDERLFRDSITCLNLGEEVKRRQCSNCKLWEWIPRDHWEEDIPCHFIPLNERGESVASLEGAGARERAEEALVKWLDLTIHRLEERFARQVSATV